MSIRAVRRRLDGNGDEALPLLARRLRDELLDPQAEASWDRTDFDLVAPTLPALPHALAELEPGVALVEPAGVDHLLDTEEKALEVDAHERRRDEAERRQGRVAAADCRLAGKDGPETPLARKGLELGAGVGDGGERLRAAVRPVPEEVEVAACLEGRARLRGDEEERPRRVERIGRAANRGGMGRVEDLEMVALEGAAEDLGRQARSAHAEQDHRVEPA